MKPHKWAKEIKAWADGAEIEVKNFDGNWEQMKNPWWLDDSEYRIKPQPKEPQYLYVYYGGMQNAYTYFVSREEPFLIKQCIYIGKIKLECDDE
jgi:hypothetical protein